MGRTKPGGIRTWFFVYGAVESKRKIVFNLPAGLASPQLRDGAVSRSIVGLHTSTFINCISWINMEENNSLSRRQWLGKIAVPAIAAGTTMVGIEANASPGYKGKDDRSDGARIYNVRDQGAKGDGKTVDTVAIQS